MQLLILLVSLFSTVLSVNEKKCNGTSVCVQKCCDLNYNLNGTKCVFQKYTELKVPVIINGNVAGVNSENIDFVICGLGCINDTERNFVKLQPDVTPGDAFFVESNGNLWVPLENVSINYELYCLDFYNGEISAFVCLPEYPDATSEELSTIGAAISLPFLFVTFVVYALLPERNLHGKCLMSFVFAIFWGYFALVCCYYNPLQLVLEISEFRIIRYCTFYAFLASFFWMNVMCIDICSTFSGIRGFTGNKRQVERSRFLIYSIYAWGMPLLFVILIVLLSNVLSSNEWYDPGVRGATVWVRDGTPTALYVYGPFLTLVIANVVLFIKTIWNIKRIKEKPAVLKRKESIKYSTVNNDKQRFNLYIKLLFGMGINWSMEVISAIIESMEVDVPPAVWYLFDFCNAAYGVFIFFIFVFKRSIWIQLKNRFCTGKNKKQSIDSSNTTFTRISSLRRRHDSSSEAFAERKTEV